MLDGQRERLAVSVKTQEMFSSTIPSTIRHLNCQTLVKILSTCRIAQCWPQWSGATPSPFDMHFSAQLVFKPNLYVQIRIFSFAVHWGTGSDNASVSGNDSRS